MVSFNCLWSILLLAVHLLSFEHCSVYSFDMSFTSRICRYASISVSKNMIPTKIMTRSTTSNVSRKFSTLEHKTDAYGGVTVFKNSLPDSKEEFSIQIQQSLETWRATGKRGVWLEIPASKIDFAAIAMTLGFVMHHADKDYLMLTHWLTEEENKLPAAASHQVGVGCVAFNDEGKLLAVQERTGGFTGIWKLPTGLVNAREDLDIACQREVMEETGIETDFVGILSFRHLHNSLHGKSDLFFICLMNPKTIKITKEDTEIAACEWIDVEMYSRQRKIVEHPVYSLLATFVERVAKDKNRKKYLDQTIVGTTAFYFPASAENETL